MPTLHPQILKAIEAMQRAGLKPIEALSPDEARRQMEETAKSRKAEAMPVARVEDRKFRVRPGRFASGSTGPRGAAPRRAGRAGDRLLPRRRPCDRQPRHA